MMARIRDHDGVEHQRADAGLLVDGVNLVLHRFGAALIFDKRQRDAVDRNGNCDITAWPSTSAVIAVPSEI
jgi:hypothetical protein